MIDPLDELWSIVVPTSVPVLAYRQQYAQHGLTLDLLPNTMALSIRYIHWAMDRLINAAAAEEVNP